MGMLIKDGTPIGGSSNNARDIKYDKTNSGLSAGNVQEAINEINKKIPKIKSGVFTSNEVIEKGVEKKYTITFDEPFETSPVVVCTTMNNAFIVQLSKDEVSKNGFSIYAYNAKTASNHFLGIHWIAVCN